MRQSARITRVLLVLLFVVVFSCFLYLMLNLPSVSIDKSEWDDLGREGSGLVKNSHSLDSIVLNIIEEGTEEILHKDERFQIPLNRSNVSIEKGFQAQNSNGETIEESGNKEQNGLREKIWEMEDQLIMARAYLRFAPPDNSNSHVIKELKLRIKEIQRVLSHTSSASHLSTSALQKMRAMDATLHRAQKAYPDCSAIASKLRAITINTEEQLRAQQKQASYLTQVASRTFPKGLHCLSMRLTHEYFDLKKESSGGSRLERESRDLVVERERGLDLYHYAVFSDNVLACAVVVNSTISNSKNPDKIVFHIITDSLNFPAIKAWFSLNPISPSELRIQTLESLQLLPSNFSAIFKLRGILDPRFYLPQLFPHLSKILLLDHDVVVLKDLNDLWEIDMEGKVNLAVEKCNDDDLGNDDNNRLSYLLNFEDVLVESNFDKDACVWVYGMNLFDLDAWRKNGLTNIFHKWLQLAKGRNIWRAGTLPIGQMVFYNHTMALDKRFHLFGLGKENTRVSTDELERSSVLHYEGNAKPWLEISVPKYQVYWNKFLNYDDPFLLQCNIHE
ncbi:hypothetical protein LUZ60_004655 [Juncus effusus]|nr:hypothetical protein LUZ60_004655 [Juncus effusus]